MKTYYKVLLGIVSAVVIYEAVSSYCNRNPEPASKPTTQTSQPATRTSEGKLAPTADEALELLRKSMDDKGGR